VGKVDGPEFQPFPLATGKACLMGDILAGERAVRHWWFFLLRRLLAEICQAELPDNGSFLSFTNEALRSGR
jgi:hypothetical protein